MSISKKTKKLFKNPKLFFKDAIDKKVFWLSKVYNKYLPKKYKAFSKYTIVSSVYNVEKYLDDYFNSIINQRLDFKNNIFMILVDDGSTDNSANIIKKYQKKYPKNIVYLYKKNGGLSSARNFGLKYMYMNKYKTSWVTFTDPDDFLDRNYFYEVDKFLKLYQDKDICMLGCNLIFYYEKWNIYKDEHPLNFKFKKGNIIKENQYLNEFIQLGVQSAFFHLNKIMDANICFDEELKQYNEDLKFTNEFLSYYGTSISGFISNAIYYYRKRSDNNSIIDQASKNIDLYLKASKLGTLNLLIKSKCVFGQIPLHTQYSVLYHFIWQIRSIVNNPEKLFFMKEIEKQEYLDLLDENFRYIDTQVIINCNYKGFYNFEKKGILNCFKKERECATEVYIERIDYKSRQILCRYYTTEINDFIDIKLDMVSVSPVHKKDKIYMFLHRVFLIEKKIWIEIPKNTDWIECYAKEVRKDIIFNNNKYKALLINQLFNLNISNSNNNIWLFIDRPFLAQDNAEHLYRYVMQNHPEQKIFFALKKESSDWERLEKEGFNLIDFESELFKNIVLETKYVFASHNYKYYHFSPSIFKQKIFVFLQHGVTQNGLYGPFNEMQADYITTATYQEYNALACDPKMLFNYTNREIYLTGFARHDYLYSHRHDLKEKNVLIFFTWRNYLNKGVYEHVPKDNLGKYFLSTKYFLHIQSLISNSELKKVLNYFGYKMKFYVHYETLPYLKYFQFPNFIEIVQNENIQKLFCESSLMITDYSSVAFEMAYLKKPVIYYQFDKDDFFNSHYKKGYFDYEKDGFGPVVQDELELIQNLQDVLSNKCIVKTKYFERMNNSFAFYDGNNCKRIYNMIVNDKRFK